MSVPKKKSGMIRLPALLLLISLLTARDALMAQETNLPELDRQVQNWEENPPEFGEGIYYEYPVRPGETHVSAIDKPELVIGYLLGRGVDVTEAWYKFGSSSCTPPGGQMSLQVIVEPAFVVRTGKKADDLMKEYGLVRTEKPSLGSCAYRVSHYALRLPDNCSQVGR